MGILGWLFILLTGLKLTSVIDWSWWWITAPLWGIPIIVTVGLAGYVAAKW